MSTPVVVQGTPVHGAVTGVANNNHHTAGAGTNGTNYEGANSSNANRDEKVESGCNDPLFVLLFLVAVGFVIAIAATSGSDALSSESPVSQAAEGYVTISVIVLFISFLGAAGGMGVLFCIPQFLIKTALLFTVVVALLVLVVSIVPNFNPLGAIMGAIFLALTICYAYFAWSRIPFATANLVTAMTAVKSNIGVVLYAYFFAILAGVWAVVFGIAFIGIMEKTYNCDDVTLVCDSPNYGILFGMFLCLFFGQQVIQVSRRSLNSSMFSPVISI